MKQTNTTQCPCGYHGTVAECAAADERRVIAALDDAA